jgi:hypothetical protein
MDHAQAVARPLAAGQELRQLPLDLLRVLGPNQAEPPVHALHVRVHREGGLPEGAAEHHVGGLARDAAQGDQGLDVVGHPPGEALRDVPRGRLDGARLLPEEPGAVHEPLDLAGRCGGQGARGPVAREELRRHLVHDLVGALGREDGGHEQLEGGLEPERGARVRVGPAQAARDALRAQAALFQALARHAALLSR